MKLSRMTVASATSVLLLGALAGCGGDDPATEATDDTPVAAGVQPSQGSMTGMPGASGLIAAVSGKTLQVQNEQTGQVAVTWTAKTTFTREAEATLADVAVGDCVLVGADQAADESADSVAATSVRITEAVDGACDGGMRLDGPGGGPGDMPSGMPTDMPTDRPSSFEGAPDGMRPGTIGEVTAVGADGFTVDAMEPVLDSDSESTETTSVTVTVSDATTYTQTVDATADDVEVGLCATASGDTDDTGALTATRIGLSEPVDGACNAVMRSNMGGPPTEGDAS